MKKLSTSSSADNCSECLGNILRFANDKIEEKSEWSALAQLIRDYLELIAKHVSADVVSPSERYNLYFEGLLTYEEGEKILEKRGRYFSEIQKYLAARLLWGSPTKDADCIELDPIETPGKQVVSIKVIPSEEDANDNVGKYEVQFIAEKRLLGAKALSIADDKFLVDMIFLSLITKEELLPIRFRRCERCGNILYQLTGKKKKYCSTTCAGAVRQKQYQETKAEKKSGKTDAK